MSISGYNKFARKFNAEITNLSFVKLEQLYKDSPDMTYIITGLFINKKSKFGDRPYISTPDFLVDIPTNMLRTVQEMIDNPVIVEQINNGKAGFKIYTYHSNRYNKECYGVEFVDF